MTAKKATKIEEDEDVELISQSGYNVLQKELDNLKSTERRKIAKRLEYAKGLGDLSENAEYAQAKEEHMINEARISELENYLSRVKILKKAVNQETVDVGSTFIVSSTKYGIEQYSIVGTQEIDLKEGKISNESPFGRAFIGKNKGETVKVRGPKDESEYKVIDIV